MPSAGPTYAIANDDSYVTLADRMVAQSFITAAANHGLYDFTVKLRKQGSPTGNLRAVLYSDDGTGKPLEPVENGISATSQSASAVSGAGANYTFDFSATPPYMAASTKYHVVFMTDADWDGTNYLELGVDGSSPSYPDGNVSTFANGASVWTTDTTRDTGFTSQYTDAVPAAPTEDDIDLTWTCDCDAQDEVIEDNLAIINALQTVMLNLTRGKIEVYSPFFPSQGYWESEWLKQGNSLPIPDGTLLLWYDTNNNMFGGKYHVVNGTVYKAIETLPKGSMYGMSHPTGVVNDNTSVAATYGGSSGKIQFSVSGLIVPSKMTFYAPIYTNGGPIRWTYYINGTNYYQTEFGTAGTLDGYADLQGGSGSFSPVEIRWFHNVTLTPGAFSSFEIWLGAPGAAVTWNSFYSPTSSVPADRQVGLVGRTAFPYLVYTKV